MANLDAVTKETQPHNITEESKNVSESQLGNGLIDDSQEQIVEKDDADYASTNSEDNVSKTQFLVVFAGLFLIVFLAALDGNIIAIAVPAIAKDFQSLSEISWLVTGFLISNTAVVPSYGKLADIFGRKAMLLTAVIIFELGSLLCGFALNMNMLIFARTLQGAGGGGVISLSLIIISDMVSIQERPKYQGIISAAFGVATIAGPLIGGIITESLSWRWNFFINVPIGIFAIVLCILFMKLKQLDKRSWRVKLKRVDFIGTFLLISTVITLLIPIQGGGTQFPWNSTIVFTMLPISAALLTLFVISQWKWAAEPLIPLRLFTKRYTIAPFAATFFLGMTIIPSMFYTPLFFQIMFNHDPLQAGEDTIPLVLSTIVFVIISGLFTARTGYYLPLLLIGSATAGIGTFLMSTMDENSYVWQRILYLILAGAGMGLCIQTVLLSCQLSVEEKDLSVVTALKSFWQAIGSVFGLAIASTYFSNVLESNIRSSLVGKDLSVPLDTFVEILSNNPLAIRSSYVPDDLRPALIHAFLQSIQKVFFLCVPFSALTFLAASCCDWKPMDVKRKRIIPEVE
ncbi:hypothetical protein HDV06_006112 [Boothiomyces sp. JEL0866]|nr:hypothetical protein HDV06_006112 [Boothiomyces sp. JEL0866]